MSGGEDGLQGKGPAQTNSSTESATLHPSAVATVMNRNRSTAESSLGPSPVDSPLTNHYLRNVVPTVNTNTNNSSSLTNHYQRTVVPTVNTNTNNSPTVSSVTNKEQNTIDLSLETNLNNITPSVSPTITKKRRIRFNKSLDAALLKCVTITGCHLAAHGKMQSKYEEAIPHFVQSAPLHTLDNVQQPSWKTLSDRFKKIVEEHRTARKRNERATGISEEYGEREQLLDDLLLEIDEHEENIREKNEEKTALEQRLATGGEEIRRLSMNRTGSSSRNPNASTSIQESEEGTGDNGDNNSTGRRRRSGHDEGESDDEVIMILKRSVNDRNEIEGKRIKIEEERLKLECKRLEEQQLNLENERSERKRKLDMEESRIELDRKRLDMEREDRVTMNEERRGIIGVLEALSESLKKK